MINTHETMLLKGSLRYIIAGMMMAYGILILWIGQYQLEPALLWYDKQRYTFEYVMQGTTILKMLLVMWIGFLWMYASRWNQYDVYLLYRYGVRSVVLGRFILILAISLFIGLVFGAQFLIVWMLYPYPMELGMIVGLIRTIVVFVIAYNSLYLFLERWIAHIAGMFIPIGLFLVGMLFGDGLVPDDTAMNLAFLTQLVAPDILWNHQRFSFLFGDVIVLLVSVILIQITLVLLRRQDAIS